MQGEKPVKAFFDKFRNKTENKPISSLKNSEGREVFDIKQILNVAEEYYKKLFRTRDFRQSIVDLFLKTNRPPRSLLLVDVIVISLIHSSIKTNTFLLNFPTSSLCSYRSYSYDLHTGCRRFRPLGVFVLVFISTYKNGFLSQPLPLNLTKKLV